MSGQFEKLLSLRRCIPWDREIGEWIFAFNCTFIDIIHTFFTDRHGTVFCGLHQHEANAGVLRRSKDDARMSLAYLLRVKRSFELVK